MRHTLWQATKVRWPAIPWCTADRRSASRALSSGNMQAPDRSNLDALRSSSGHNTHLPIQKCSPLAAPRNEVIWLSPFSRKSSVRAWINEPARMLAPRLTSSYTCTMPCTHNYVALICVTLPAPRRSENPLANTDIHKYLQVGLDAVHSTSPEHKLPQRCRLASALNSVSPEERRHYNGSCSTGRSLALFKFNPPLHDRRESVSLAPTLPSNLIDEQR